MGEEKMIKKTSHVFPVSKEAFWKRLYLDPEYLSSLYREGMGCEEFEIREMEGTTVDGFSLTLFSKPKLNMPRTIQKLLGNSVCYTEKGVFTPSTGKYVFQLFPSPLGTPPSPQAPIQL